MTATPGTVGLQASGAQFAAGEQVVVTTASAPFTAWTSDAPVDPTRVILVVQVNDGAPTQSPDYGQVGSPLSRVSVGVYEATLDTTGQPGTWTVEIVGTGACAAVATVSFEVTPVPLAWT